MRPSLNRAVLLLFLLSHAICSYSQFNLFRPEIIGQTPSPLTTNINEPITIQLSNLIVLDGDALPQYPNGFTLEVSQGKNYKVNDATVTPDDNFTGRLKVPVRVNDGNFNSKKFDLEIEVAGKSNVRPEITGQAALAISQDQELAIELVHLQVNDPDNLYPNDFTLHVYDGNNYSLNGNTLKPKSGFTGTLKVPVSVNDGKVESKRFDLIVEVTKVQNIAPVITGQAPVSTIRATPVPLTLNHLTVNDPDNKYPDDFSLKVSPGTNYTVDEKTTVTPVKDFIGELTVKVKVNDGTNDSEFFDMKVQVNDDYKAPVITGQAELVANEDETIVLQLSHLTVTGGTNTYPNGFSLIPLQGTNYTYTGTTIKPKPDYSGVLSVNVKVNDGKSDSAPFKLTITIKAVNDAPVITGQLPLTTNKSTPLPIDLTQLKVSDVDNTFPDGFTLKISNGDNYSVFGNDVHPAPDFVGILTVNISVNDGAAESNSYPLKITIASVIENKPPVITGQKTISIVQNSALAIHLSHLTVSDPDNKYPTGFSLKVLPGDNYSVEGTTVRPLPTFANGTLSVAVIVNDGTDDSAPYNLKIQVVPSSSTPIINSQKELVMQEDSAMAILLSHLEVTDADNLAYPKGFSLIILPVDNGTYTVSGNTIRPALNLNGFIEVGVKVSDGVNTSNEFKVSILVTPVNDPPEILNFANTELAYEPGSEPLHLFEDLDLTDVDNDHLSMAEIGFRQDNYSPVNDELVLTSDSTNIKAIYDPAGILFLVGYGTLDEYKTAIRSIHYNYKMTQDQNGNPSEILAGTRTIYINLHDGQQVSNTHELKVNMETEVSLDIPNAFTPNGDMSNDTWHIHTINKDQLDKAVIRVYNKRGLLLYESIGLETEWNGIVNGQQLPVDTYYYTIDLNLSYMKKTFKGAVTILR